MKVGDKVLVYKNNWYDNIKRKGTIVEIFKNNNSIVYRVDFHEFCFYGENGKYKGGCNIFTDQRETIELDKQEVRDCKLKELGIL